MICCFGELLLRFSPAANGEWIRKSTIPVFTGGAELNVATALANWNIPVTYFTALPDTQLTTDIVEYLQSKKIDTSAVHLCGNRIGVYYLPEGSELKNAGVIYDRAGSSFSLLRAGEIDWDKVLDGCTGFHFTAITPALNEYMPALCEEVLQAAKQKGITVSVDLNYRSKLWQYGQQPTAVMPQLMKYCDIVMGNIWSAESLLGISANIADSSKTNKNELVKAAGLSMRQLHEQYPNVQTIACTFRMQEEYFAVLQHGAVMSVSQTIALQQVVDKAGSGDCFMAGLLYGLHHKHTPEQIVNFASMAAVGKLAERGDSTQQTIEQIKKRLA